MENIHRTYETFSVDSILDRFLYKESDINELSAQKVDLFVSTVELLVSNCSGDDIFAHVRKRIEKIKNYKQQLAKLQNMAKIEQRTDEWYAARKTMITASDFAQSLGESKYASQKQFYQKKCNPESVKPLNMHEVPALRWGVMFEPVAATIYCKINNCLLHDFGLLRHPKIEYFGASPDGITNNGIMVEIKCPYKRKISHAVPPQYFYQIQGQLSVCELGECDYFECEFGLYDTRKEFDENAEKYKWRGIIVEIKDPRGVRYEYSNHVGVNDALSLEDEAWLNKHQAQDVFEQNVMFWHLSFCNTIRVYRNDAFLDEKFELLKDVWATIVNYQNEKAGITGSVSGGGGNCVIVADDDGEDDYMPVKFSKYLFVPTV